jgi:signal peptidase I
VVSLIKTARRSRLFELAFTVVVALGLALSVQAYAVKPYRIPSG